MLKSIFAIVCAVYISAAAQAAGKLSNLSVLGTAPPSNVAPLIVGFAIKDAPTKEVLLRGIGPGLANFGVSNYLTQTTLRYIQGSTQLAQNTQWPSSLAPVFAQNGAFPLTPGSFDSAILAVTSAGLSQNVHLYGESFVEKSVLVELYDNQPNQGRIFNLSVRNVVPLGQILTVGFTISGAGGSTKRVLIRGIGPTLLCFGVPDVIEFPQITVFSGGTPIASNQNWYNGINTAQHLAVVDSVGAFRYSQCSTGSTLTNDSALILDLPNGGYTVQLSRRPGFNAKKGDALIEVWDTEL